MSSWISNLPFRGGGSISGSQGHSNENFQILDKQDINFHLVKAQELRKLKTLRKKWFVLYEDPDSPIDPDRKRVDHRKTRRRRTEIEQGRELDESDILGDDHDVDNANDFISLPARLEYYDSEKKWRDGVGPKKRIILKDCFDINRKKETANQFVITVYTFSEGLDILFENDQDMEIWLDLLLCCKNGGRSIEGRIARPAFESVWDVDVIGFTPDSSASGFQMSGRHRLCVIDGFLHFYAMGSTERITFQMREIRKFGCDKRKFRLIIGSNSISGVGELAMFCKDREAAENLQESIRAQMARVTPLDATDSHNRPSRRPTRHIPSQPRSDWAAVNDSTINGRTRSYSDCNKKNSPMARSIPTQKSHLSTLHHNLESAASRNRTISEGNSHLEGHPSSRSRGGWGHRSNLNSGSPLSPGSFVSSESAGSSNSVDSDTMAVGSFDNHKFSSTCMTPSSEHPSTTTIIEESSAESCIDPATFRRNRMDELKDDNRRPSLPATSTISGSSDVHYTPIEVVSAASKTVFGTPATSVASAMSTTPTLGPYAASPPSGSGVHYSTIVGSQMREEAFSPPSSSSANPAASGSDYMIMTPASLAQHSGSSSSTSSLKRHAQLEPERKRLSMLGLEEDPFPNLSHAGVTSPSSQSSYNPLDEDEAEPSYLVMSPVGSSGGGTLPKRGTGTTTTASSAVGIPTPSSYHRRTGSSSFRSSSVEVRDEEDSQYIIMSPTVTLSKTSYNGRGSASRATPTSSATAFGTSPSAALTSHFSERLPLFEPLKKSTTPKFESSTEEVGGYLVMSPVNADSFDRTPRSTSLLSEKFRASSVDTSGPPVPRSKDSASGRADRRDVYKRSSLCSEDEIPRGWSPTHPGPPSSQQPLTDDHNPIEDYADFEPPKAALYQQQHHQQLPPSHHHSAAAGQQLQQQRKSNFIPISQAGAGGRRASPAASSSSIISGTPNSTDGISTTTKAAPLVRSNSDDDLMDDDLVGVGESSELEVDDQPSSSASFSSAVARPARSAAATANKAGSRASNTSLASRGSSSRYIDIPGGGTNKSTSSNVSAQSSVTSTATNSGIASFLGSIFRGRADSAFRNRSDSVPSRPASDGRRRHRTQSEGEHLEANNA